jgi:hypothetical protein
VCYIKLLERINESSLTVVRKARVEEKQLFAFLFINRIITKKKGAKCILCDRCMKYHSKVINSKSV